MSPRRISTAIYINARTARDERERAQACLAELAQRRLPPPAPANRFSVALGARLRWKQRQRLRRAIERGQVTFVVCTRLLELADTKDQAYEFLAWLWRRHGAELVAVADGIDTSSNSLRELLVHIDTHSPQPRVDVPPEIREAAAAAITGTPKTGRKPRVSDASLKRLAAMYLDGLSISKLARLWSPNDDEARDARSDAEKQPCSRQSIIRALQRAGVYARPSVDHFGEETSRRRDVIGELLDEDDRR